MIGGLMVMSFPVAGGTNLSGLAGAGAGAPGLCWGLCGSLCPAPTFAEAGGAGPRRRSPRAGKPGLPPVPVWPLPAFLSAGWRGTGLGGNCTQPTFSPIFGTGGGGGGAGGATGAGKTGGATAAGAGAGGGGTGVASTCGRGISAKATGAGIGGGNGAKGDGATVAVTVSTGGRTILTGGAVTISTGAAGRDGGAGGARGGGSGDTATGSATGSNSVITVIVGRVSTGTGAVGTISSGGGGGVAGDPMTGCGGNNFTNSFSRNSAVTCPASWMALSLGQCPSLLLWRAHLCFRCPAFLLNRKCEQAYSSVSQLTRHVFIGSTCRHGGPSNQLVKGLLCSLAPGRCRAE